MAGRLRGSGYLLNNPLNILIVIFIIIFLHKDTIFGKKQRGGGELLNNPLNILLIGLIAIFGYKLLYKPNIVKEKIIYQTIEKEVDDEPYREDIYKPDVKRAVSHPPFHMRTRGAPQEYDMVGFLQDPDDSNKLQQLYGRRTYPNSDHWNYFVKSDQYHQIPIPVSLYGQNCTDERGCKELQDKGTINLFNKEHTATIYKPEPYYYNPYVI